MRRWIIEKLGGFPDLDSAISHIKELDDAKSKHKILTEAVKHLFNAIGPEDVLRVEKGRLVFRGKPMTEAEENLIKAEAQQLVDSRLWYVLRMDVRWQINKKMFHDSKVVMDLVWGQLLTFYDDTVRTRLKQLAGKEVD